MRYKTFARRAALVTALLAPTCPGQTPAYQERYRPQLHFSPARHWTNDPNGVVYFDGEYHLFFQYNPFGDLWGHMSWGHAVSRDLIHWQELPVALPEENGIMIFTGSTVIDEHNTSGFCSGGKPCMVAIYSGHTPASAGRPTLQTQNLAYSNDRGRTWTKYPGNPVLNLKLSDFRDPHVFWSDAARQWIMAVALPNDHKVLFYSSNDLKQWTKRSEFGPAGATAGQWECPTIVELPVNGEKNRTRWVLKVGLNPGGLQGGSGEQYFIGSFDGTRFVNDNPPATTLWADYGKDCYCALPFTGMRDDDAAVVIGWMNNWQYASKVPTQSWRGQMTIPRAARLRNSPEGIRLFQRPVESLPRLRDKHFQWQGTSISELNKALNTTGSQTFEIRSTADLAAGAQVAWRFLIGGGAYTEVGYDSSRGELYMDRTHSGTTSFSPDFPVRTTAPMRIGAAPLRLRILVDQSTVEVFAQNGRIAMSNLVYPPSGAQGIEFRSSTNAPTPLQVDMWTLKSAWTGQP